MVSVITSRAVLGNVVRQHAICFHGDLEDGRVIWGIVVVIYSLVT